ncbi:hypothetical protein Ae201684P_005733 [Aphanomyces euteiches]|uniref:TAZ-type domain-containing protein n=1 Tax=Aphanomyces euteiches TaxID=100861 RepID=A0A6G0X163_9STRA|nr:hypothetical protein Ae201684_009763 [Aphanomyces euteiches]KAH9086037.1 hypothetical protein Ae201684P_005733 [Aphanomyces euteiches]
MKNPLHHLCLCRAKGRCHQCCGVKEVLEHPARCNVTSIALCISCKLIDGLRAIHAKRCTKPRSSCKVPAFEQVRQQTVAPHQLTHLVVQVEHVAVCMDSPEVCANPFCTSNRLMLIHVGVCQERADTNQITLTHSRQCSKRIGKCKVPECTQLREEAKESKRTS